MAGGHNPCHEVKLQGLCAFGRSYDTHRSVYQVPLLTIRCGLVVEGGRCTGEGRSRGTGRRRVHAACLHVAHTHNEPRRAIRRAGQTTSVQGTMGVMAPPPTPPSPASQQLKHMPEPPTLKPSMYRIPHSPALLMLSFSGISGSLSKPVSCPPNPVADDTERSQGRADPSPR